MFPLTIQLISEIKQNQSRVTQHVLLTEIGLSKNEWEKTKMSLITKLDYFKLRGNERANVVHFKLWYKHKADTVNMLADALVGIRFITIISI